MKLIKFLLLAILCFFVISEAFAASVIDSVMCNASNIVTGPAGKAFASFAVISVGIGFFTGRISWGLMIGVAMGIATIYGAPTVVSSLTGKALFECQNAVYNTVCEGENCYSCPVGYSGSNCDICAAGFFGANCDQCDVGYSGINCSQCSSGYYKVNGLCKMDCSVTSQNGVADTTVHSGNGNLSCLLGNYSGSLSYVCDNGNFSVTTPCGCVGNYDVNSGCSSCITGYSLSSNCVNCDSGFTKVSNVCQKDCYVTGVAGITDNTLALPLNGTLACNSGSSINYSCVNGVFSSEENCSSATNVTCSGGSESEISISGVYYKIHKFTTIGSFNFKCSGTKEVQYLVVAGGGSGGISSGFGSGGGGAGGFLEGNISITANVDYVIKVGNGGIHGVNSGKGENSSFGSSLVAIGGGAGGEYGNKGKDGGSGGGSCDGERGGSATSGQGNKGADSEIGIGSGGGGAGSVGSGQNGGDGKISSITGTNLWYAAGGGASGGVGGSGVGGSGGYDGGIVTSINGSDGINNTGSGGGGGGSYNNYSTGEDVFVEGAEGKGGSGIVIIRYVK
jgi:type IV secretory pathway VirB2 component (pilin)